VSLALANRARNRIATAALLQQIKPNAARAKGLYLAGAIHTPSVQDLFCRPGVPGSRPRLTWVSSCPEVRGA
jgi:hypothetical protein